MTEPATTTTETTAAPRDTSRRVMLAELAAIFLLTLLAAFATGTVKVMYLPQLQGGTYGVAVGTNNSYCFAAWSGQAVDGSHVNGTCETAR